MTVWSTCVAEPPFVPAKAGTQRFEPKNWAPAFAGANGKRACRNLKGLAEAGPAVIEVPGLDHRRRAVHGRVGRGLCTGRGAWRLSGRFGGLGRLSGVRSPGR